MCSLTVEYVLFCRRFLTNRSESQRKTPSSSVTASSDRRHPLTPIADRHSKTEKREKVS